MQCYTKMDRVYNLSLINAGELSPCFGTKSWSSVYMEHVGLFWHVSICHIRAMTVSVAVNCFTLTKPPILK